MFDSNIKKVLIRTLCFFVVNRQESTLNSGSIAPSPGQTLTTRLIIFSWKETVYSSAIHLCSTRYTVKMQHVTDGQWLVTCFKALRQQLLVEGSDIYSFYASMFACLT